MDGWPERFEVLPTPKGRVIEAAKNIGKFIFKQPEVKPCMSDHFYPEHPVWQEPTDGEAIEAQHGAATI